MTGAAAVWIVALTPAGAALGQRLGRKLAGAVLWLPGKLGGDYPEARRFDSLKTVFAQAFTAGPALVGIMATGIAVRHLGPLLRGKDSDPAVVILDEGGQFAISLLSGHLGGANELARQVAGLLGATPVITTASDVQGLPAVDVLAAGLDLTIENLAGVKEIQMALLHRQPVRLVDEGGHLQQALEGWPDLFVKEPEEPESLGRPGPAVYVGYREYEWPAGWLRLRPRLLVAGVGCNRGTPAAEILAFLREIFSGWHLAPGSLRCLASITAKQDEAGLVAAARELGVEVRWFTKEELEQMPAPNPSAVVRRHMGVASVCEAAALKAAGVEKLLVPKQKRGNVTLAVAAAG